MSKRMKWQGLAGLAAAVATLASVPSSAASPPSSNGVRAGLSWDRLQRRDAGPSDGVGGFVGYRRSLADDWDAWVEVGWSGLPRAGRGPSDLLAASAGVSLVLDASRFRPEVFAGAGCLGSPISGDLPPGGFARIGAALGIRVASRVSVELRGEYRIPFPRRDRVIGATSLGAGVQIPF